MATCEDFKIQILNRTGVEIRATRFQYTDRDGRTQTENIFSGGSDTFDPDETKEYTRNLQGIGNEFTTFTVTFQRRLGSGWGPNDVHEGNRFKCEDNEERLTIIT
jgi:hypothetical protein